MSYEIITDTSSNLYAADIVPGLTVLPFSFTVNGQEFTVDPAIPESELRAHYERLRKKATVKTSQINLSEFSAVFEKCAAEDKDVLYIGMSGGISGTFRQAELAAEEASGKYPDHKFLTVDSKNAGYAEGALVLTALQNRDGGMPIEKNARQIEELVPHMRGVFVVDDLAHLHRSGRVSGIVALAGTMLGIKPLLKGDDTGHIVMAGKVRGKRAALDQLAKEFTEHVLPEKQTVYVSHCDAEEDAKYLAEKIRNHPSVADLRINWHEPMTSCHLGPGSVELFYLADQR